MIPDFSLQHFRFHEELAHAVFAEEVAENIPIRRELKDLLHQEGEPFAIQETRPN